MYLRLNRVSHDLNQCAVRFHHVCRPNFSVRRSNLVSYKKVRNRQGWKNKKITLVIVHSPNGKKLLKREFRVTRDKVNYHPDHFEA